MKLIIVSAIMLVFAQAGRMDAANIRKSGAPEINEFCSAKVRSKKHPFLFYTLSDIKAAKKRAGTLNYRQAIESINSEAEKAREIVLESIDRSWWDEVKTKSWSDTYPVIYEKTCIVPLRMAQPACYAALRFAVRGDDKDAEAAKKILLHLSDYSFEFEHYDVGMNYSVWGHLVLNACDILFERFTDAEQAKLDAFFTRMGHAVMKNDIYWVKNNIGGGINNHLAWHKMMLGCIGLFYGQDELVEYALNGPRGILPLLELGLVDDGLWCESSLNYHFTAIVPMVYLAEAMRNVNYPKDLYTITTANGRSMKQAFDAMFGVLFPDGSIPPVGDCYGRQRRLSDEFSYTYAYRAYGDGRYAWLLEETPKSKPEILFVSLDVKDAQSPDITSRLYPEHGYVFLRSCSGRDYWGSDGWCAFVNFDKSGVHCHQDKLSLMLFGCGKMLIRDVEARATAPHAFSSRIQQELNRSALSQNTVMMDYRDQKGAAEKLWLEEYRDLPDEKVVTVMDRTGLLYDGVRQSRTICVRPEYVLDVFQIVSNAPHNFGWIIHTTGKTGSEKSSLIFEPAEVKIAGPGRYLSDFRAGQTDDQFRIEWAEAPVRFAMTMAAEAGTKVILCGYPQGDEPNCATIPMAIVERHAANTTFAVVYQAAKGPIPQVEIRAIENVDGRAVYQVKGPWGTRRHLIPHLQ